MMSKKLPRKISSQLLSKANPKEWVPFFEHAISENGEARVRTKLRILAALLLPRLDKLTDSTLFGFLNLYEAFPEREAGREQIS